MTEFDRAIEYMKQESLRSSAIDVSSLLQDACSRFDLAEMDRALEKKAERDRKAAEATIELNESTKKQNELLLAQMKKSEEARVAAEKQAREERVWKWVMFVIALLSIVVAVVF